MKIIDLYHETKTSLLANITRTFLTILGIVIGIASVIIMLAVGQGAKDSISASINSLGTNVLTVRPGGGGGPGQVSTGESQALTIADADALGDLPLVKYSSPLVQTRNQVIAGSNNMNATIVGVSDNYDEVGNIKLSEGNFISQDNLRSYSKVAVLGATAKTNLFGNGDAVGKRIKIKTNSYIVIGIAEAKGGSGFNNPDENIYVPLTTAMQYMTGGTSVGSISVTTENAENMTQLQTDMTELLLKRHRIPDPDLADFRILNQQELLSTISSVATTFTILLGSVAGISLVVGGIGIMNMMLTTVRERTREIGLRKAIGAQKRDIRRQFLAEAVVITLCGGLIGIFLGYAVSFLVSSLGIISATVSLFSVVLSFSVSAMIGIIFGYYPAKKAAELNPIDALRYE